MTAAERDAAILAAAARYREALAAYERAVDAGEEHGRRWLVCIAPFGAACEAAREEAT